MPQRPRDYAQRSRAGNGVAREAADSATPSSSALQRPHRERRAAGWFLVPLSRGIVGSSTRMEPSSASSERGAPRRTRDGATEDRVRRYFWFPTRIAAFEGWSADTFARKFSTGSRGNAGPTPALHNCHGIPSFDPQDPPWVERWNGSRSVLPSFFQFSLRRKLQASFSGRKRSPLYFVQLLVIFSVISYTIACDFETRNSILFVFTNWNGNNGFFLLGELNYRPKFL